MRLDRSTVLGLALGLGGIVIGNLVEGGSIGSLIQVTAGLIVFAGTFGAVMVSSSQEDLRAGLRLFRLGLYELDQSKLHQTILQELVAAAQLARKESLLSLEPLLEKFSEPFMKRVFRLLIDGVDPSTVRDIFEGEIEAEEERKLAGARIWTDAGGYAPTIGIIGAVLGLIAVMSHLSDTSQLGKGIAVAFVATIYGVASANLIFLPLGNKIKRRIKQQMIHKYMIIDGATSIVHGLNHYVIEEKLRSYLDTKAA